MDFPKEIIHTIQSYLFGQDWVTSLLLCKEWYLNFSLSEQGFRKKLHFEPIIKAETDKKIRTCEYQIVKKTQEPLFFDDRITKLGGSNTDLIVNGSGMYQVSLYVRNTNNEFVDVTLFLNRTLIMMQSGSPPHLQCVFRNRDVISFITVKIQSTTDTIISGITLFVIKIASLPYS